MNCRVHSIARYTHAQAGRQVLPWALISFVAAGQARLAVDGRELRRKPPYLAIFAQGLTLDFAFTHRREQWVIALDVPGLVAGRRADTVNLTEADGGRVVLSMLTPIIKEHVSGWEGEFLRMREAFDNPHPANRLRVRTGVGNVFRYVIDQQPDLYPSPAARLRWLIDEDRQAQRGLEELSRQCGYSASRLRVLFERAYGQSPQAYRSKRRMHVAADLLVNSDQTIKEISAIVGCRHVSHFCLLFKRAHGLTPTQYQARFP